MSKKSISQIKEEFEQADAAQLESLYEIYGSDERSGVQKLIGAYRKKAEAMQKSACAWKRCAVLNISTVISMAVHTA